MASKKGTKNNVTIYDIAKVTGLSVATVSRALNKKGYVSEEAKEKILQAQKELNYVPNAIAQSLKIKKTNQIMICLPDNNNPFYFRMIAAFQEACKKEDYSLLLSYYEKNDAELIKIIRKLQNQFADGLILVTINLNDLLINEIEKLGIPVILCSYFNLNIKDENRNFDYVGVDTKKGIYYATKHLIDQGHRKIAYVGMSLNSTTGQHRFDGYKMAMAEYNLAIDDYWIRLGDSYEKLGYESALKFATDGKLPTAICAANDLIVLGIYDAFEKMGIKIPDEVSVIGMDNDDITHRITPKISSVDIAPEFIGQTAIDLLFNRIKTVDTFNKNIIFEPRLIIRDSSVKKL
ncbi:MAG: LacI family transcriptional regulator [Firmicutes bacterium]|nr:LacI family transcriptional regulator [Bacillota bacterium]